MALKVLVSDWLSKWSDTRLLFDCVQVPLIGWMLCQWAYVSMENWKWIVYGCTKYLDGLGSWHAWNWNLEQRPTMLSDRTRMLKWDNHTQEAPFWCQILPHCSLHWMVCVSLEWTDHIQILLGRSKSFSFSFLFIYFFFFEGEPAVVLSGLHAPWKGAMEKKEFGKFYKQGQTKPPPQWIFFSESAQLLMKICQVQRHKAITWYWYRQWNCHHTEVIKMIRR